MVWLASLLPTLSLASSDRWAVAVLLTTEPSRKGDGWTPRSVRVKDRRCAAGPTLCAVLVLRHTVMRYGNLPSRRTDFVALVDEGASEDLISGLKDNGVRPAWLDFEIFDVFDQYLLMRKFFVLKMEEYERVLLLDSDAIVVGSLRHFFERDFRCGEEATEADAFAKCWPETDAPAICEPRGSHAAVVAQQTAGTPVLTAFFLVKPNRDLWLRLAHALTALCGGHSVVCNRQHVFTHGWNTSKAPHEWALRKDYLTSSSALESSSQFKKGTNPLMKLTWKDMGAGFTDQGFAEYFFAQHLRSLYSISHRTCKMKYVHFNTPPKPWFCPGDDCRRDVANDQFKQTHGRRKNRNSLQRQERRRNPIRRFLTTTTEPAAATKYRWGGHKCGVDWWWQFDEASPTFYAPPGGCVATCLTDLRRKASIRGPVPANHTGRCKDWSKDWPPLQAATHPNVA
mmetsp:Transcript_33154/g.105832  ORF Transcript_33154/g.105832 Transcript_33154/m.105832 type:complete len:454 (+) Transcript_33154:145-1506(+)|eukprot:CAMPEP_0118907196 /NCGR_PEP_ID=MMETSP1166-20130328/10758_1 /TAXON_ID=1104430 /ORGANISM="Chrysoreinhardia sp, Strain CCMP3193" /LENGTH=453 /DNA_ID=CAMNT_0006846557 /DNA_START=126 /DNA_END=1487 /DNA_ORIENTATION=-